MKTGKWICVVPALVLLAAGCARKSQPVSLHDAIRSGSVEAVKKPRPLITERVEWARELYFDEDTFVALP